MKINLKYGVGKLRFGMTQNNVEELFGTPDENREDPDNPEVYFIIYNDKNIRLTFEKASGNKLIYIDTTNQDLNFNGHMLISKPLEDVKNSIFHPTITKWKLENYHSFSKLFNEENWITLSIEYDKIVGIELGVTFMDEESYLWPDELDTELKYNLAQSTITCNECGSLYFRDKSRMNTLCPECSCRLYNHENCYHNFEENRCKYCFWDGSKSEYLDGKSST